METTDNPMNVDFTLTSKELRELIGKWITFKIWNCGEMDRRRIYTGEVILQRFRENCYMCENRAGEGKCTQVVKTQFETKCPGSVALVDTFLFKPDVKIRLFSTQIVRDSITILPTEEVLVMKLEIEGGYHDF